MRVDVDQGVATLFVSPPGNTMLVDSGKNGHGTRLRSAMSASGVTRIDHLVTTHYHEDHYGGADGLTTGSNPIEIGEVHDRGDKGFLPAAKFTAPQAAEMNYGFKVLVEEETGRILGAHLVGPHADEDLGDSP